MSRYDEIELNDDELAMLGGLGSQAEPNEKKVDDIPAVKPAAKVESKPAKVEPAAAVAADEALDEADAIPDESEAAAAAAAAAEVGDPDADDEQVDAKQSKAAARKAKGGYSVPNWRLAEVAEERDRERREKAELQAKLDAYEKAAAKVATPAFDFDAAEEQVALLLSEQDIKGATTLQRQIREELKKEAKAEAAADAEAVWAQREAERSAAAERTRFDGVVQSALERFPELDADSPDANDEAIDRVNKMRDRFQRAGSPASEALEDAVDTVMSMAKFAKAAAKPAATAAAPAAKKAVGPTKEQIQAAVDAAKGQPPATSQAGVGNRAAPAVRDFAKMSANEIANMSKDDMDKHLAGL
jgi:hypothetical protein